MVIKLAVLAVGCFVHERVTWAFERHTDQWGLQVGRVPRRDRDLVASCKNVFYACCTLLLILHGL